MLRFAFRVFFSVCGSAQAIVIHVVPSSSSCCTFHRSLLFISPSFSFQFVKNSLHSFQRVQLVFFIHIRNPQSLFCLREKGVIISLRSIS